MLAVFTHDIYQTNKSNVFKRWCNKNTTYYYYCHYLLTSIFLWIKYLFKKYSPLLSVLSVSITVSSDWLNWLKSHLQGWGKCRGWNNNKCLLHVCKMERRKWTDFFHEPNARRFLLGQYLCTWICMVELQEKSYPLYADYMPHTRHIISVGTEQCTYAEYFKHQWTRGKISDFFFSNEFKRKRQKNIFLFFPSQIDEIVLMNMK